MKPIAMVIEFMLTTVATPQWTGGTSAVAPRGVWGWGGVITPETSSAF